MPFSIQDAITIVEDGLALVQKAAPIAAELGVPGAGMAGTIAGVISDIANNTMQRVQDGQLAATTTDKAALAALIVKLRALNDAEDAEAEAG